MILNQRNTQDKEIYLGHIANFVDFMCKYYSD